MILTVTPNPSLDLLFESDVLVWDDANRLDAPRRRPGGQGINLARAATQLGGIAVPIAPLGGRTGFEIEEAMRAEGSELIAVPIQGETRVFVGARETSTGRSLLLNPRGPELSAMEVEALRQVMEQAMRSRRPAWVAACGSIPRGVGPELYEEIGRKTHECGARFVPDCDGEPLARAAAFADLLVPNAHEAGRLLGREVRSVEDGIAAAAALRERGTDLVVVKLGAEGAALATADGAWYASGPEIASGSAVGAGDAFLAGFLIALQNERPLPESLREGVAAGSAVLLCDGSGTLRHSDVSRLRGRIDVHQVS